jgi:hypothetical protein
LVLVFVRATVLVKVGDAVRVALGVLVTVLVRV